MSELRSRFGPLLVLVAGFVAVVWSGCGTSDGTLESTTRPAGSESMVERLAALNEQIDPEINPFVNDRRVDYLRQMRTFNAGPSVASDIRLARELLLAGETEEAIDLFESGLDSADGSGIDEAAVRRLLAIAYLRLGEQQNCILDHSIESCLLPIRGRGVHARPEGSTAAKRLLAELLAEAPEDLELRWLMNLVAMTLGEYPDQVPEPWLVPPSAFESEADLGRFWDVAPAVGADALGLAGGVVTEDFDGDGRLDLMVSSWGVEDQLRLFRNLGDEGFEEVTRAAGLDGLVGGLNLVHADFDNDGAADVLVLRGAWLVRGGRYPNSLLRNDGTGRFIDVTEEAGLLTFRPTQTAAWGDFDNDGWLDLFVGNESVPGFDNPCQLFRNLGDGTFEEVASDYGLDVVGYVKGVAWGDYDNDGWPDLYLSKYLGPNLLFRNDLGRAGKGFREVTTDAGVEEPRHGFATWFFDADNDGWLDLFVAGFPASYEGAGVDDVVLDYLGHEHGSQQARLYRNNGDGTFENRTAESGLDGAYYAMGAGFGDLDNDGRLDLYLGTGAPSLAVLVANRMFRNAEDRFLDVTSSGGFGHLQKGHGIAFADLDNDGDQDVYAVMGGAYSGDAYQNALFLNPGHGNRWLTVELEGRTVNRSAIGARLRFDVAADAGHRSIFATVGTGGSFGSSSLRQEVGLGAARSIERLEVQWPGGGRQVIADGLELDTAIRVTEGAPSFEVLDLPSADWSSTTAQGSHGQHP